jgi:hypothetical protein
MYWLLATPETHSLEVRLNLPHPAGSPDLSAFHMKAGDSSHQDPNPRWQTPEATFPKSSSFGFCSITVRKKKIGQFSFFKSYFLSIPKGFHQSPGPPETHVHGPPNQNHQSPLCTRGLQVPILCVQAHCHHLHVIKNLTKVNFHPLYQVQAAFLFFCSST